LRPETWEEAVNENTKMFFLETPSNPGLAIVDLEKAAKFSKEFGLLLNVDNCFATPYLQNPAKFWADIISHSATKFIDGQGRVLGGVVAGSKELVEKVYLFIRRTGGSISPFNAWILSKSLETLAVRMDRHCENALSLAKWLESHPRVSNVKYPFLKSHPQYEIAKKQMRQGGGIVTFEIEGGIASGVKFLNTLKMLSLTANLGDSRSIASHPASTTHLRVPSEERLKVGITDGLIRISVGLEHIDDIIEDIEHALKK
jgi:O-succinylhomoserine sulfhydrylase